MFNITHEKIKKESSRVQVAVLLLSLFIYTETRDIGK
jgi:hypothetical protein